VKKVYLYIVFLLIVNSVVLLAQNALLGPETSNWYFGENAGISFDILQKTPEAAKGSLITEEGCASVSDSEGNLLFYASGETIWNRNHNVMKNGNYLPGGHSSTQAVLILQKPGQNDVFYVLNTQNLGGTLSYSIVDLNADNGLGEVVSRNNIVADNIGEKLSAVYHSNDYDVWILTKDKNAHIFRAFLLNQSGIQAVSVDSYIDLNFDLGHKYSSMGYLNFSSKGDKLACASYSGSQIELYDFDKSTGKVSNPIILKVGGKFNTYGVCFSPDASKLYASYYDYDAFLVQYDLANYDSISINDSRKIIAEYHDGYAIGAIQAGPDEKLYISRYKNDYLAVVNKPNEIAAYCEYDSNGVYLDGNKSRLGLPNFTYVNRYSKSVPDPNYHNILFEVKNFEGKPGEVHHKIQIFGKVLNQSIPVNNKTFNAKLEFEAASFLPMQLSSMRTNTIDNGKRAIRFEVEGVTLDTLSRLLYEIPGTVMLGNRELNQISLTEPDMGDTSYKFFIRNVWLRINDVCMTSYRKVTADFTNLNILNVPVDDILTLSFRAGEAGDYHYRIYSSAGEIVQSGQFGVQREHTNVETEIDISRLYSGYFIIEVRYLEQTLNSSFIKL